jgi:Protein of unknown function (DUF551)
MNWIKCSDRLPEMKEKVFVYIKPLNVCYGVGGNFVTIGHRRPTEEDEICICHHKNEHYEWKFESWKNWEREEYGSNLIITHWAPIELPEKLE